jgi:hypothetical protein
VHEPVEPIDVDVQPLGAAEVERNGNDAGVSGVQRREPVRRARHRQDPVAGLG